MSDLLNRVQTRLLSSKAKDHIVCYLKVHAAHLQALQDGKDEKQRHDAPTLGTRLVEIAFSKAGRFGHSCGSSSTARSLRRGPTGVAIHGKSPSSGRLLHGSRRLRPTARWVQKLSHVDPEKALQVWSELTGTAGTRLRTSLAAVDHFSAVERQTVYVYTMLRLRTLIE